MRQAHGLNKLSSIIWNAWRVYNSKTNDKDCVASTARKSLLSTRLDKIQAAINGTLDRGVAGYAIDGRRLDSFTMAELLQMERATLNEIARLDRGSRFGGIGFKRVKASSS